MPKRSTVRKRSVKRKVKSKRSKKSVCKSRKMRSKPRKTRSKRKSKRKLKSKRNAARNAVNSTNSVFAKIPENKKYSSTNRVKTVSGPAKRRMYFGKKKSKKLRRPKRKKSKSKRKFKSRASNSIRRNHLYPGKSAQNKYFGIVTQRIRSGRAFGNGRKPAKISKLSYQPVKPIAKRNSLKKPLSFGNSFGKKRTSSPRTRPVSTTLERVTFIDYDQEGNPVYIPQSLASEFSGTAPRSRRAMGSSAGASRFSPSTLAAFSDTVAATPSTSRTPRTRRTPRARSATPRARRTPRTRSPRRRRRN